MKKSLFLLLGLLTSVTMMAEVVKNYPYRGYIYQYNTEKHIATITGLSDKGVELIDIPSSIIGNDGLEYPVTAIDGGAFSGCSNLRRLVLPETLMSIGSNAFSGCNDLKHIWCKVEDPSVNTLKPGSLPDVNLTSNLVTLYVPSESSKSLYEKDQDWNARFSGRIFVGGMSEPLTIKLMVTKQVCRIFVQKAQELRCCTEEKTKRI